MLDVEHQTLVSRMIRSAEGGTGPLHKTTMPTSWRGGEQILKEEEEDVNPSATCEEKKNGQNIGNVTDLSDKPWRSKELKFLEERMPRILEKELGKTATSSKAKTGVECVAFLPKFCWICQRKHAEKWWNSGRRWSCVGDCCNKLAQRCFP